MADFRVELNTSTDSIMSMVKQGKIKVSDKTKQLIFNFCNNDLDKKVTNINEQAMLNSWFSGDTRIKMPEAPENGTNVKYGDVGGKGKFIMEHYDPQNPYIARMTIVMSYTDENGKQIRKTSSVGDPGADYEDMLVDTDGDNYADYREVQHSIMSKEPAKVNEKAGEVIFTDKNLNGIPDDNE